MADLSLSSKRILIVDDSEEIHADFRRILNPPSAPDQLAELEAELFGAAICGPCPFEFHLSSAYQGEEARDIVAAALERREPFSLAFVDMRMPPGWDGLETIHQLWRVDPELQIVLCTAYSDYSWTELVARLGTTDQLLILKKPFDNIEVVQLACAITEKWRLARQARSKLDVLESMVRERTAELESARDSLVSLNGELEQACRVAERARSSQSAFLANMSHEIRTPMNAVLGTITLLRDSRLSVDQEEYVDTLSRSAEALLVLLNDLLDLSKIEAGQLTLEATAFDLAQVVEEVAELLASPAEEKGVELLARYAPSLPRHVIGDPGRMRQILNNLVSNAVKFTGEGTVRIDVDGSEVDAHSVQLDISVIDSGIGIPAERVDNIFERFVQAEATTTRRFGGTGLGLAIVREIAELMGGSVRVESTLGVGSRFIVSLVAERAKRALAEPAASTGPRESVLLLTTSASLEASMRESLSSMGIPCEIARSFAEATCSDLGGEARSPAHSLWLVDAAIFADPERIELPAGRPDRAGSPTSILLTGVAARLPAERIRAAGYRGYLPRVSAALHVRALVEHLRDQARASDARAALVTRRSLNVCNITERNTGDSTLRRHGGRILVVEDNRLNQKIAHHLLRRLGCDVEFASNGQEALEALDAAEFDLILMDCQMPEMDGFSATAEIRRREIGTPVIALTANAMPSDREHCLRAGMDDYVSKPISLQSLAAALDRWLPLADEKEVAR